MNQRQIDNSLRQLKTPGQFDAALYGRVRDAAVRHRSEVGIGKSQAVTSLYHFWCFYLRDNFTHTMYQEFLDLARQDVQHGDHYSIECYFRFCSYGLEKRWDQMVFEDFQREALADWARGNPYGLEKLSAFLNYQKFEFPIQLMPDVKTALDEIPPGSPETKAYQPPKFDHQQARPPPRAGRGGGGQRDARRPPPNRRDEGHGGWTFGRMQPASAPSANSPMRQGWQQE